MKQQFHEPSHDASQTYDSENYTTITFDGSPFCGQRGRILKRIAGSHPELHLEMPTGEKIKVDVLWTNYQRLGLTRSTQADRHRIDLAQAEVIIQFLEYLWSKLTEDRP